MKNNIHLSKFVKKNKFINECLIFKNILINTNFNLLVFTEFFDSNEKLKVIKTLNNNITFWIETVIITSNEPNSFKQFLESNNIKLKYVYGDATVLKTIIRSNPGFFLMRHGYVRGKWHFNNIPNGQEVLDAIGIKT